MIEFIRNNKLFSKLAGINLVSKVGDRLFYTAMLTIATSLPSGGIAVMIVSASETLPILLSLFLGVVADKQKNKVRLLVFCSYFRMAMYIGIGLIFRNSPTLILVLFAAGLNFLSDISGNYASALFSPFTKILVRAEEMEQAQGIVSLGTQLVSVLATFIGASLLAYFRESSLAFINASVFMLVAIMYLGAGTSLKGHEEKIKTLEKGNMFSAVNDNIRSFCSDNVLLGNLIQLAMLNGFFGGLTPVFALFINTNNELMSLSNPVKISLLSGIITVFMILGNAMTTKIFKRNSIFNINILSDVMILFVGVGFVIDSIWIIMIANSCIAFLLGIVAPRFSAEVVNRYPVERIGGIITCINALLVIAPPVTSLLFPMLATFNIKYAYWGIIIYSILLLVICLALAKKNCKKISCYL